MKYIVYLTTNKVNNKIYIGVHQTKDPEVFDGYIGCSVNVNRPSTYSNPKTAFQYAVKKYGASQFHREILYVYNSAEEAFAKESEIVDIDFLKRDNNYNMITGGGKLKLKDPIYQFDKEGNLVKYWESLSYAIDFYNGSINSFYTAMQFKESYIGFFWSRKDSINLEEYSKGEQRIPVYKYTKNGKCIECFSSITEAAEKEQLNRASLSTAIKLQSLVNKEFYYSTKLYDELIIRPKKSLKGISLYLYTLDGKFIQSFDKSKDLLKYFNVKSWNTIYRAIHSQNGIYKDYQIKTEFLGDTINPAINKSKAKKVDVYDKIGNFIKTCNSVQEASKEFQAHTSSVNRVLRGLAHTANNYVFKFHNN